MKFYFFKKIYVDINLTILPCRQEDKRRTSKLRNDFQTCLERFQDVSKVAATKSNETIAPKPTKGALLSNPAYVLPPPWKNCTSIVN